MITFISISIMAIMITVFVIIKYQLEDLEIAMAIFLCLVVIMVTLSIQYYVKDYRKWQQFKIDHNCKLISKTQCSITNSVAIINGIPYSVVSAEFNKNCYMCDDSLIYCREE